MNIIKCPHCGRLVSFDAHVETKIDTIKVRAVEPCKKCHGTGYIKVPGPGDGYNVFCDECGGEGAR